MKKHSKSVLLLDSCLAALGLWRKPVARDGFSLFRAISEQLFQTQTYYKQLYDACRVFFSICGKDPDMDWNELEIMRILSMMHRVDIHMYDLVGDGPFAVTNNGFERKVFLCRVDDSQLDPVYPSTFVQNAAVCQSIIYDILYRGVFQMDSELTDAVMLIRDQNKKKLSITNRLDNDQSFRKYRSLQFSAKDFARRVTPPVPYRIAKALDPSIYRNVELDIWEEEKRDLLRESNLNRKFAPGDKCQIVFDEGHEVYHGHIQEISDNEGPVLVFIEELGAKHMVPYSSLRTTSVRYHSYSETFLGRGSRWRKDMPIASTQTPQAASTAQSGASTDLPRSCPDIDNNNCPSVPNSNTVQGYISAIPVYPPVGMVTSSNNMTATGGVPVSNDNMKKGTSSTSNVQLPPPPPMNQRYPPPAVPGNLVPFHPHQNPNQFIYPPVMNQMPQSNYTCICVPFLETFNMSQVNLGSSLSQDPSGKDLPLTEMNTLRFFYNLGVEHYRMISQGGSTWSPMEMGHMVPVADQINGNACGQFLHPAPSLPASTPNNGHKMSTSLGENSNQIYPVVFPIYKTSTFDKPNPQADKNLPTAEQLLLSGEKSDKSKLSEEACGDCNDSGCDSDSISGSAHDDMFKDGTEKRDQDKCNCPELDASLTSDKGDKPLNDVASIASSLDYQEQSTIPGKPKGKRKYYMYGNHKLIKPIKDIPPRFLTLLAETSAARARCEGEPIIVPFLPPRRPYRMQSMAQQHQIAGFNPEAKCFVPGQPVDLITNDPSIVAYSANELGGSDNACNNPAPVMPGSSGMHQVSENLNNTSVYSPSQSSYTVYVYGSPNYNVNAATNPPGDGAGNLSISGGGNSNTSCMPSHSTGAGQPYHPSLPCPVYYTNQQFTLPGPQTCVPAPNAVPQGQVPFATTQPQHPSSQAFHHSSMMHQVSVTQMPVVQASQ